MSADPHSFRESYDEALARQFADRHSEAWVPALEHLWTQHETYIRSTARRFCFGHDADADDAMQNLFLRLSEPQTTFDPDRGPWIAWVYRVLQNLVLEFHRRSKAGSLRVISLDDEILISSSARAAQEQTESWNTIREWLDSCLSRLEAKDSRLVIQHWLERKSVRVIAEQTDMTQNQATVAIRRAFGKLKKCMESKQGEHDER